MHCGAGTDTVSADTLDLVDADCESVSLADVGERHRGPPADGRLGAARRQARGWPPTRSTRCRRYAEDDRGVALVRFLDDDRVVCEDAAAPYTCAYRARGEDVGRNTLTAVAVDGAGQTASAQRAIVVEPLPAADDARRSSGSVATRARRPSRRAHERAAAGP